MLNFLLALLAGVVTIATPCTLPVLPILLGSSMGQTSRIRPALIAFGFVASFSAVALLLGGLTQIFDFDPNILRSIAAVLLLGFGLLMIFPAPFERITGRIGGFASGAASHDLSNLGGFVLGTTLGLVWTPCAGPVLGSILTIIATSKDIAWASVLLIAYTIGAAIPMLIIAYGGQAVTTRIRSLRADHAAAATGLRRRRHRLRRRLVLSIRHADRGLAHRLLSHRPARPLTRPQTPRRLP